MTVALSPEQVIAFVRELSADVRAVAVLDGTGAALAGDPAFATAGAAFAATVALPDDPAGPVAERVVPVPAGVLFVARTATHAVVAAAGPLSLAGPTALDVRAAVLALAGARPPAPGSSPPPAPAQPAEPALGLVIRALEVAG